MVVNQLTLCLDSRERFSGLYRIKTGTTKIITNLLIITDVMAAACPAAAVNVLNVPCQMAVIRILPLVLLYNQVRSTEPNIKPTTQKTVPIAPIVMRFSLYRNIGACHPTQMILTIMLEVRALYLVWKRGKRNPRHPVSSPMPYIKIHRSHDPTKVRYGRYKTCPNTLRSGHPCPVNRSMRLDRRNMTQTDKTATAIQAGLTLHFDIRPRISRRLIEPPNAHETSNAESNGP